MTKSQKQVLSVLFHLAVLGGMLMVYDAGKLLIEKFKGGEAKKEKTEDQPNGKGNASAPTGGTTMEDLMKQKTEREREEKAGTGKDKVAEAKQDHAEDKPQGKGKANAPTGGTTMEDLMKQKAKREMEKKAISEQQ